HEFKVMADHIHLFVEVPPRMSISKVFQLFKGISARVLKRNYPFLQKFPNVWSPGKFFRSVGNVRKDVIENYIRHSQGNWNYFDIRRSSYLDKQTTLKAY
ncbi:IS200/IS605 family transposase, partial [Nanoarchaeota archaeon]